MVSPVDYSNYVSAGQFETVGCFHGRLSAVFDDSHQQYRHQVGFPAVSPAPFLPYTDMIQQASIGK